MRDAGASTDLDFLYYGVMIRFTALKFTLSHFVNQVTRPTECFVPNLLLNTTPEALIRIEAILMGPQGNKHGFCTARPVMIFAEPSAPASPSLSTAFWPSVDGDRLGDPALDCSRRLGFSRF